MQKKKSVLLFGSLRGMVTGSLLVALSIVCGKFLQIPVGEMLRFSFENLPILLAGMVFGPIAGGIVGIAADLIGCLAVGYAINPLITCGAAAIGCLGGIVYRLAAKVPLPWRVLLSVAAAHVIGSVTIKTFGLAQFYDIPFLMLMVWRLFNYAIVGAAETLLLYALMKNKAMRSLFSTVSKGDD